MKLTAFSGWDERPYTQEIKGYNGNYRIKNKNHYNYIKPNLLFFHRTFIYHINTHLVLSFLLQAG